jgi:hypothetical protein
MNWRTDIENAKDGKYYMLCNMDDPAQEVAIGKWLPLCGMFLIMHTDIQQIQPTHWAEINLPGKETEEQRIVHDLKNYIDYCQYSAIYLSKRAEWLKREHSDEKEEIDSTWKECSEYIMKADPLENIVNNTCLRYKEITKEAVENLWKDRQGHYMFSEIPPEYTKDFYKSQ